MRLLALLCGCLLLASPMDARAQSSRADSPLSIPAGVVVPKVVCQIAPEQSYALYLPSKYSPDRAWPIIYAFDFAARGALPVERIKEQAEIYGFIVVGSNNSQNGPLAESLDAAKALWQDTHERYTIDDRRVYFAGLSGGARLAVTLAKECGGCAAGVIACGAGFLPEDPPTGRLLFSYFATVGDADFNLPELVRQEKRLNELGVANHLYEFRGGHEWAPPEGWAEALAWMEVQAMKQGRRPRDAAFIAQRYTRDLDIALHLEQSGSAFAAYEEYRRIAEDYLGLIDTSAATRQADSLDHTEDVRRARKRRADEMEEQERLTQPIIEGLTSLAAEPADRPATLEQLSSRIQELRAREQMTKNSSGPPVTQRALAEVFYEAMEAGQARLRAKDNALGILYFQVATQMKPRSAWAFFYTAVARARAGNRKEARRAVERALQNGLPAGLLQATPELAPLKDAPEIQRILRNRPDSGEYPIE